ncbi:OsmC family peroxiredoxin [Arsenicitalea aurantiaca]|uniref:OsmC family peroxiredoxin n=1 Tax=Arsenicitalea aurantiaca TaxID=1783274 RepID=A0A433X8I3_9HYPH|nr:OsmC family protein [Arsenicitalea aurantiaca]RUT30385.1 OsmC family peroxiredoxin [Arsenicitalea aurantiaca]
MVTVTSRPTSVSARLGGSGAGSIEAGAGATAALAGLASDPGFTPLEFMDAALAGCLVLSVRIAARKSGWGERLQSVEVEIAHIKAEDGPSRVAEFTSAFKIVGDFTDEEREALIASAHEICTVGNTFAAGAVVRDIAWSEAQ